MIETRINHPYLEERETPIQEIPFEFQLSVKLPGGREQVVDTRLCYNLAVREDGSRVLVECGSVYTHAQKEGFFPPQKNKI